MVFTVYLVKLPTTVVHKDIIVSGCVTQRYAAQVYTDFLLQSWYSVAHCWLQSKVVIANINDDSTNTTSESRAWFTDMEGTAFYLRRGSRHQFPLHHPFQPKQDLSTRTEELFTYLATITTKQTQSTPNQDVKPHGGRCWGGCSERCAGCCACA